MLKTNLFSAFLYLFKPLCKIVHLQYLFDEIALGVYVMVGRFKAHLSVLLDRL
jgi:hypothetical protein